MLRLIILSTIQSLFLVSSQIFLKIASAKLGTFRFTTEFFLNFLVCWQFALSGIFIVAATFLWMHILKHFEFSVAYPMISISYVFGMLAAIFIFHETVPFTRWIGVLLILLGVIFVAKQ
jgi:undecaprenyl phosphate-alpha-L-ara4N flippase subunit ArnE